MNEHPIKIHVRDDLRRTRLTVFFRGLLVIPHIFWLFLWGITVEIVYFLNWLVAMIIGRPAAPFQRYTASFLRYSTSVNAYYFLAANPFPPFSGKPGIYPVELEVPLVPEKQSRWKTFFRGLLVIPAAFLNGIISIGVEIVVFLSWLVSLIMGRIPRSFRNFIVFGLLYSTRVSSYMLLITGRYPSTDRSGISYEGPAAPVSPAAASEGASAA
jgi:hypothetical protein